MADALKLNPARIFQKDFVWIKTCFRAEGIRSLPVLGHLIYNRLKEALLICRRNV